MTITRDTAGPRPVPLIAGFVLALALLGGVAWLGWRQTAHMQETAAWVAHTHQVQAHRNLLPSLVLDIESNQRSYVLTGLPKFLDEFEKAVTRLPQLERRLEELTRDERQRADLSALKPLVAERVALARQTVELRQNSGAEAAAQQVATLKGKKLTDEILARLALMDARGDELLVERSAAASREAGTTVLLTLTGTALSVALLIALTLRENRRRLRAESEVDRFFTLSLDMLGIASADGYFKRVSPAFTQTLGWSAGEMLARPFLDFVHPDDRAATLAEVERPVVAGDKVPPFENRQLHKDGSWRVLSWKSVSQPDGQIFATARDVTELRLAEDSLRRSEQDFRSMAEAMPQIVWATRPDGWNIFFNQQWVDYTGLTMEESHGHGWNKPFHPDDQPRAWDAWQRATQNNERYSLECRLRRADGVYRWWLIRGAPMRGANGEVLKWFGTCTDIEEFKQAQEALHRSEENLYVTLASIGDAVLATDAAGKVTRLNPVAEKLMGWTLAEAQGRPVAEVFHIINEETREPVVIPVEKVLATGRIQGLGNHTVIIARDGTERPIADSAAPIRDRNGQILGVVVVFRDVTEEKKAAKAIRKLNDELEQRVRERTAEWEGQRRHNELLLNSAGEGLYGLDLDGRVTFINPAGAGILGYTVAELLGQPMHAKCHHTHADGRPFPREDCPIHAAKRDGLVHRDSDDVMWRKDGSAVAVEYTSTPMRDEEGQLSGAIVVFRDITERKRADEVIRTLNAELEQRVKDRTRQLAEANQELTAFNQAMVGREQRIIQMKEEVNALCRELGREPEYPPVWTTET